MTYANGDIYFTSSSKGLLFENIECKDFKATIGDNNFSKKIGIAPVQFYTTSSTTACPSNYFLKAIQNRKLNKQEKILPFVGIDNY